MARASRRHAPQSDHRQTRRAEERGKAHPSETRRAGMRTGRVKWRQQERCGPRALCSPNLAPIMDGCGPEARRMGVSVMGTVRPPAPSHMLVPCQKQNQASASSPTANDIEQGPTLGNRQAIMSKDHAGTAWQTVDRLEEPIAEPFVGHQPQMRQHGLAGCHRRFYSGAHAR
jgi:hypothetical protein